MKSYKHKYTDLLKEYVEQGKYKAAYHNQSQELMKLREMILALEENNQEIYLFILKDYYQMYRNTWR